MMPNPCCCPSGSISGSAGSPAEGCCLKTIFDPAQEFHATLTWGFGGCSPGTDGYQIDGGSALNGTQCNCDHGWVMSTTHATDYGCGDTYFTLVIQHIKCVCAANGVASSPATFKI